MGSVEVIFAKPNINASVFSGRKVAFLEKCRHQALTGLHFAFTWTKWG